MGRPKGTGIWPGLGMAAVVPVLARPTPWAVLGPLPQPTYWSGTACPFGPSGLSGRPILLRPTRPHIKPPTPKRPNPTFLLVSRALRRRHLPRALRRLSRPPAARALRRFPPPPPSRPPPHPPTAFLVPSATSRARWPLAPLPPPPRPSAASYTRRSLAATGEDGGLHGGARKRPVVPRRWELRHEWAPGQIRERSMGALTTRWSKSSGLSDSTTIGATGV